MMGRFMRLDPFQLALEDAGVAAVGFEEDVEGVAEERDAPDDGVDAGVPGHSDERPAAGAHPVPFVDHGDARPGRDEVAEAGNEAEDRIPADRNAEDAELAVQRLGQPVEPFDPAAALGRLGRQRRALSAWR